jgi:hypothetical protein
MDKSDPSSFETGVLFWYKWMIRKEVVHVMWPINILISLDLLMDKIMCPLIYEQHMVHLKIPFIIDAFVINNP